MNPFLIAFIQEATKAVAAALVGGAASVIVAKKNSLKLFNKVGERRDALLGEWRGSVTQQKGVGEPLSLEMTMRITAGDKRVIGDAHLCGPHPDRPELGPKAIEVHWTLTGGFFYSSMLKLDYQHKHSSVVQFGSLMLHLSSDGDHLNGFAMGWGHISQRIVTAQVALSKWG